MAIKPVLQYPRIPRIYPKKTDRRDRSIFSTENVRPRRIIHSDRYLKVTKTYEPNYLDINTTASGYVNLRSGVKNPGWRVAIAKGEDASSGYSRQVVSIKQTPYTVRTEDASFKCQGSGTLGGVLEVQIGDWVALDNRAIGRLKNRLNGNIGNAQLAAPLAESREIHRIVRQINGIGMSVLKAVLAIKHTKGKSAAKQFGDIWLGFGFGINPMLKDLESAANAILKYVVRMDRRIVIHGTAATDFHSGFRVTASSDGIAQGAALGFNRSGLHQQSVRYTAGIDLIVGAGSNYSVTDHLGLKISDVPGTLWELTPFSWVVDYGFTVGDWLDDMFYTVPGTVKYVTKSYKYHSKTYGYPVPFYSAGVAGSVSGGSYTGEFSTFTRTKLAPTFPARSLRVRSMDEVASYGVTKLLNLASVIAGRHSPNLHG